MEENKEVKVEVEEASAEPSKGFSWGFWTQQVVSVVVLTIVSYTTSQLVADVLKQK